MIDIPDATYNAFFQKEAHRIPQGYVNDIQYAIKTGTLISEDAINEKNM